MTFLLSLCLLAHQNLELSDYQHRSLCKYEHDIRTEANRNGIDPTLLAALIYVESGFYKTAVSSAGACGLTQVVPKWTGGPETKKIKYTCEQLKDPKTSIKVGAEILSYHIRVYATGDVDKGLCYYNAGTKCITRKGFYKRLGYVKKVNRIYRLLSNGC
jgi:soluble lytic murein transglycosylase-like protein